MRGPKAVHLKLKTLIESAYNDPEIKLLLSKTVTVLAVNVAKSFQLPNISILIKVLFNSYDEFTIQLDQFCPVVSGIGKSQCQLIIFQKVKFVCGRGEGIYLCPAIWISHNQKTRNKHHPDLGVTFPMCDVSDAGVLKKLSLAG